MGGIETLLDASSTYSLSEEVLRLSFGSDGFVQGEEVTRPLGGELIVNGEDE